MLTPFSITLYSSMSFVIGAQVSNSEVKFIGGMLIGVVDKLCVHSLISQALRFNCFKVSYSGLRYQSSTLALCIHLTFGISLFIN
jgi:hypothetical protein